MVEDLLYLASLVHSEGTGFFNPLKFHSWKIYVQLAEVGVPKLEHVISNWIFHQIGCINFMHLHKFFLYILPLRSAITMAQLLQDFTMYSFRLNWTFNPFDKRLLTESKLACNWGAWGVSLSPIRLILPFTIVSLTMDVISMASTTHCVEQSFHTCWMWPYAKSYVLECVSLHIING